jgi:tetraacyldisaccharide 4'-kinase
VADARLVERAWRGDEAWARALRVALAPLSWAYGGVVRVRNAGYDRGWLRSHAATVPTVSVGNLSVGGTGKTPVSAWLAAELLSRGARPAIVLRGYGDDEPRVHATLNPGVPVVVAPDRVDGIARAAAAGANVVVLDDAFQHRRARRDRDVVLVSADGWREPLHLLPAGPWREPLAALRRASAVVVTRKAASREQASAVQRRLREVAPELPAAIVHLAPDGLRRVGGGESRPMSDVRGRRVLVIAAIGEPEAFAAQLRAAGADVTLHAFPDHHAFTAAEVAALAARGASADLAVCTLKDAVKLGAGWPADRVPLWYVSQRVVPEAGEEALERLVDDLLSLHTPRARTAGSGRHQSPTHGY